MTDLVIRPIAAADDPAVAQLIRRVMAEMGATGPGFSVHDIEVDSMSKAYAETARGHYAVVSSGSRILGGAGIAPLKGGPEGVCELKKMYFESEIRHLGFGQRILEYLLKWADSMGFQGCYLETLTSMSAASKLYVRSGFVELDGPLGATGHFSCDRWYFRPLGNGGYWPVVVAKNHLNLPECCEITGALQDK